MAKNNKTVVLTLTLLIITGLFSVAAAIIWRGFKSTQNGTTSPTTVAPAKTTTNKYSSIEQVPLASERQVNYSKLRQYLQQKD